MLCKKDPWWCGGGCGGGGCGAGGGAGGGGGEGGGDGDDYGSHDYGGRGGSAYDGNSINSGAVVTTPEVIFAVVTLQHWNSKHLCVCGQNAVFLSLWLLILKP